MKKRVADIVIESLIEYGITDCFAVVGGGAMHLDNALGLNKNMNVVFQHHEQACSIAAEGYAKISGNMAAVCVTSGPGATNALTGVMGAWVDSVPMCIMSGQMRYELSVAKTGLPLRFRGNQEFDIIGSVKNMTKYSKMIIDPFSIKKEIYKAVHIALSGRRGPVWLDIPLDIQNVLIDEADLYPVDSIENTPNFNESDFVQLNQMLCKAKRPVILAGNGIANSGNLSLFREFANKIRIPIVASAIAADVMYDDYDLYYGLSGFIGPRTGNFILQNADLIIALGTSLGFKTTGYTQDKFAPHAKIIMIDVDKYEVKKPGVRVDCFINSDLREFFEYCIPKLSNTFVNNEWIEYCHKLKNRFTPFEAIENLNINERVCSYMFWKKYQEYENNDSITVLGNNTGISSKLQIGVKYEKSRIIANNNCGSMGYDLPAAVGTAIACKKDVICVTGDGSIMMNLQELQTIKHYNLPIKIVVFSNDGYNAIRQTCKNFFNGFNVGCDAESGISFPSFSKVADTFGFNYKCCYKNSDLDECLKWLFEQTGQVILEIEQRLDDPITPKVMSRIGANGEFVTPSIEDMYPFISKEEYDSLMLKD